nr:hypothetical protein GCM10020093_081930 [Planobispora longispora]
MEHIDELEAVIRRRGVSIVVLATPAAAAQQVADRVIAAGITSILNFAPVVLSVPEGVDIRKVDLSIELQILAFHEQRKTDRMTGGPRWPRNGPRRWTCDCTENGGEPPRADARRPPDGRARRAGPPARRVRGLRAVGREGRRPMSVLVVGLSHRTAPVALLERVSVSGDRLAKLLHDVHGAACVAEVMVVSTCNRVEVYAVVDRFHAAVNEISELLSVHSGVPKEQLSSHLYVHYEDQAVEHLFSVGAGLDSMVVGEGQILGQVRQALRLGQERGTLGATLNELVQQALRVGKRAHAETGIDRAGASLVGWASPSPSGPSARYGAAGPWWSAPVR